MITDKELAKRHALEEKYAGAVLNHTGNLNLAAELMVAHEEMRGDLENDV